MEGTLTLLLLVAAVAARGLPRTPKPDYVPSPDLLDSIFNPPASAKPVEIKVEVTPNTEDTMPSEKKDRHVRETVDHTHSVEADDKIRVGADWDKDWVQENMKFKGNDNTKKAGDEKHATHENMNVTAHLDHRDAFGAGCLHGQGRVGGACVTEDVDPTTENAESSRA